VEERNGPKSSRYLSNLTNEELELLERLLLKAAGELVQHP
jgi:hypothetical protein